MAKSLKYNFSLNLINTIVGLIFPLITFPYAARILDPDGIGLINFYSSIVAYITMFCALGIGTYGVRAVAQVRDDDHKKSVTTAEILSLHLMLILVGYVVVALLCLTVPRIQSDMRVFIILSSTIFFNAIGVNWFYQAIEDFKFITIRSLAVKFIALILLFLFVKNKDDVANYAIILAIADAGNNILNFHRLRKHINRQDLNLKEFMIKRHIIPTIKIFSINVIISIYIQMAPVLLGFMVDNDAVGYFAAAARIQSAIISITTALSTATLPRMSYYYGIGDKENFARIERSSLSFVIMLSLPMSLGLMLVSQPLIQLFAGDEFISASSVLALIAPTVFFIGIASIISVQILYPQGKESISLKSSILGAIISLPLTVLLIPDFKQDGAAIGLTVAEATVTISLIIFGRRYYSYRFINIDNLKVFVSVIVMGVAVWLSRLIHTQHVVTTLMTQIAIGVLTYCIMMTITRHSLFMTLTSTLWSKISRHG